MVVKRAYKRVSVNDINREVLINSAVEFGDVGTVLGLDIAKQEIVACLRWGNGNFERPWKVVNPKEIGLLVELCELLKSRCDGFTVGLESTGTYGDSIRYALTESGISVQRVSGKAVSDYHEIFDGVPSQHDGKDAAMVAELVSMGKGSLWPYSPLSENQHRIRHQVLRIDALRKVNGQWMGRLEGLLARHWPELTQHLKLSSVTLLKLIATYGSPAGAIADPDLAKRLRTWGKQYLLEEKLLSIVASARSTAGLPMSEPEACWAKEIAEESLRMHREELKCERVLRERIGSDPLMERYSKSVGYATVAVLWSELGDPALYSSAGSYLKALGLNLKERSSGQRIGQLAISKRGPAMSRRWLYFWALRAVQRDDLRSWYAEFVQEGHKSSRSERRKMKGLIALMRKLAKSLWHARVHDKDFDYSLVVGPQLRPTRRPRKGRGRADKRSAAASNQINTLGGSPSGIGTTKPPVACCAGERVV
jgi:transposase